MGNMPFFRQVCLNYDVVMRFVLIRTIAVQDVRGVSQNAKQYATYVPNPRMMEKAVQRVMQAMTQA